MSFADYEGKRFSLWLVDDKDEQVIAGGWIALVESNDLVLVRDGGRLVVAPEWFDRIRAVGNEAVREILLGADFFVQLKVGSVGDEDAAVMLGTGMKWPD